MWKQSRQIWIVSQINFILASSSFWSHFPWLLTRSFLALAQNIKREICFIFSSTRNSFHLYSLRCQVYYEMLSTLNISWRTLWMMGILAAPPMISTLWTGMSFSSILCKVCLTLATTGAMSSSYCSLFKCWFKSQFSIEYSMLIESEFAERTFLCFSMASSKRSLAYRFFWGSIHFVYWISLSSTQKEPNPDLWHRGFSHGFDGGLLIYLLWILQ